MKKYFNYQVTKDVIVKNLVTIETLDIGLGFSYPEESHTFFEFVYIDSGSIFCVVEDETIELYQGDFYLIPPTRWHSYSAKKDQLATIFIICFDSHSECLSILDEKIALNKEAKHMVSEILKESKNAFVFPFDKKLRPMPLPAFGAQQMVENNIEKLLIHLIRTRINENNDIVFVMNSMELENSLSDDIIQLLKKHVYDTLTLARISDETHYSKTFINTVFKKNTGLPIMKYYMTLKIQEAKTLLRNNVAVTDVANQLKFDSPTYFTKVFKKYTNLTPTDYKKTII